jgi:dihydroorotate dehydrogenase
MNLYPSLIRPLLFQLEAERAHEWTLQFGRMVSAFGPACALVHRLYAAEDKRLATQFAGLHFSNPIGLPAGFDKNAVAIDAAAAVGFGTIEVGSVSLHPSAGNPVRPRLFRVPADEALMVFYGVPSDGIEVVMPRVKAAHSRASAGVPVGVSIVETNTGVEASADAVITEFIGAARRVAGAADYLVLNLSCPNSSGGLSVFDEPRCLRELFAGLGSIPNLPPVIAKARVPLDDNRIAAVLQAADGFPFIKGFIPSPGLSRPYPGIRTPPEVIAKMPGTLSGPFRHKLVIQHMRRWSALMDRSRHVLIGGGGIRTADEAYSMIRSGASLLQVYGGLVYQGPVLVKTLKVGLAELLARDGFGSVSEAVGIDVMSPSRKVGSMVGAELVA